MTTQEIRTLPIDEKIRIMAAIWEDMRDHHEEAPISQDVIDLLKELQSQVNRGEAQSNDSNLQSAQSKQRVFHRRALPHHGTFQLTQRPRTIHCKGTRRTRHHYTLACAHRYNRALCGHFWSRDRRNRRLATSRDEPTRRGHHSTRHAAANHQHRDDRSHFLSSLHSKI